MTVVLRACTSTNDGALGLVGGKDLGVGLTFLVSCLGSLAKPEQLEGYGEVM